MGFFDKQKEKDRKAHALRDAAMKKRREEEEADQKERQRWLDNELRNIRAQTNDRKNGRLKP